MSLGPVKIRIVTERDVLSATLDDSEAARDFASLLPLTVTLEDYAETEKIADLPRRLSTTDSPAGTAASVGDIAYYAPWGNLALFYRSAGHADGLVRLGRMEGSADVLRRRGPLLVTIEPMEA